MPKKRKCDYYTKKLTHLEIIKLVNNGRYIVDLELGTIRSGRTFRELYQFYATDDYSPWVHLFAAPAKRSIQVCHIVWIVGNNCAIPKGFFIHHRNRDRSDNSFKNLFALSFADHNKLHNSDLICYDSITAEF